jgi:hypothetical protein
MKLIIRKKVLIFSFSAFVLVQVFFVPSSLAIEGNTTYNIPNPVNATSFETLVQAIAKWFVRIMVPIAAIIFLYAGFLFLTSGGDEEKVKKAKRAITYAIVGLVIVLIGAGFITLIKSILEVK